MIGKFPTAKKYNWLMISSRNQSRALTISFTPRFLCVSTNLFSLRQFNTVFLSILDSFIFYSNSLFDFKYYSILSIYSFFTSSLLNFSWNCNCLLMKISIAKFLIVRIDCCAWIKFSPKEKLRHFST